MYLATDFKEFIRHKLNEQIKTLEKLIKEEHTVSTSGKPDWIDKMTAEFEEITKDL
jgi:hypothetical protein